jgi:hypothetical protein
MSKEKRPTTNGRRVPEARLVELRKLQTEAEEAAAASRVAELKARLALEGLHAKMRELLKEQGAPVTYAIHPETGEIAPPAVPGGR